MLLTKEVKVKWNSRNKKALINSGYVFTKLGDKITINIEHLSKGSNTKIEVKCDYCGEVVEKSYNDYNKQIDNYIKKDCCGNCRGLKQIDICQYKYGVNGVAQVPEIKKKQVETIVNKYGVDNISKIQEVKEKKKKTTLSHYGVEYFSQSEIGKKKIKESIKNKYGVEHHLQLSEIYKKQVDTNLEKYGVENVFQSEEIKGKIKEFNLKHYGVEFNTQRPGVMVNVKEKANKTMYLNGTAPCSKQQLYLCKLLNGELNYPVHTSSLDVAFLEDMIDLEYDGSGHNLNVKCGSLTEEEFNKREVNRNYALLNSGWKIIRIKSLKDFLPTDEKIIEMFEFAKKHFENGNSWIEFNIDEHTIISSIFNTSYDYGNLRTIKDN